MKPKALVMFTLLAILFGLPARTARAEARPEGMRFLPDVRGQFEALTEKAEPLGFHIGGSPNPSACRHYQAMVRVNGPDGTPFFLVTRSGNQPTAVPGLLCDDSPGETGHGHLVVFRMGSRDRNGERLRSNRLSKLDFVDQTVPPPDDAASIYYTVTEDGLVFQDGEGGTPPRTFQHPGGMQVVGNMLAMAAETPCQTPLSGLICEPTSSNSMILFFDVTDPERPVLTSRFSPEAQVGGACGVLGITPLPGGRNLMVTTGGDNSQLFFYRSTLDDLSSPALSWEFVGTTPGPDVEDAHQTLNFLRQGGITGPLFLAGARGHPLFGDHDRIDLYSVVCNPSDCAPGAQVSLIESVNSQRIRPVPSSFGSGLANLAAASTFYVSPSGELLFYATEHDNDGPQRTVKAGEWRHADVVRGDSPTLLPHAILSDHYEADEGSGATLDGAAEPPLTRAWIQLFKARDLVDLCPVVDYDDHDLDTFNDLDRYCVFGTDDGFRSRSWYAPEGCAISMTHSRLGGFKTLRGTGVIERDPDLRVILNNAGTSDMEDRVDMVDFDTDCDAYYETPVGLEWDLDRDGSFETTGLQVPFDAAALDGPAEISLPLQARHPDGGRPGPAVATILVRNVAPVVGVMSLVDGAGNSVPSQIPFVLIGLPLTLRVDFLDPGLPDHQTALISWGDGSSDGQAAFASFDEAFGDGTGEASATHAYAAPGTFSSAFSVTDDDGGAGDDSVQVDVLTVAQALDAALGLLDDEIAGTNNVVVRGILQKAHKALHGNFLGRNGAKEMIEAGNEESAIAFLGQAIGWLRAASTLGADVTTLIAILQQMVVALGAGL